MDNWKEYIEHKFQPKDQFTFVDNTGKDKSPQYFAITHKLTGTSFWFYDPSEDWTAFGDIHFYNDRTKGWSGEFEPTMFNNNNVVLVDKFFEPAFNIGWTVVYYYLFNSLVKTRTYLNLDKTGKYFTEIQSKFGCLSVIIFPIYFITSKLMDKGIIGSTKTIYIKPVVEN